ncbi:hypothetical protein Bca101_020311 [Brassica carinata]
MDIKAADMEKNGNFSFGSWDDCYKESFAVEETSDALEAEKMSRGFTTEDFFKSSGGSDIQPSPSINNTAATSTDIHPSTSIDMHPNSRSKGSRWPCTSYRWNFKYQEKILQTFFKLPMDQTISSCNNAASRAPAGNYRRA